MDANFLYNYKHYLLSYMLIPPVTIKIALIIIVFFFIIQSRASASPINWDIEGLSHDLKTNVSLYLKTLPKIEPAQLSQFRARIIRTVKHSLQALGYYQPTVTIQLPNRDHTNHLIIVDPGYPIIIRHINISLLGEAKDDQDFSKLIKTHSSIVGKILNDNDYESIKSSISYLAQSHGYLNSNMSENKVIVHILKGYADIVITLNSGRRHHFGKIQYENIPEPTIKLLKSLVNIKQGELYDSIKISKLNQYITSTDYFSRISVFPKKEQATNYEIPIYINVTPRLEHELNLGAGYSTDEGVRFSAIWEKPWVNHCGHSLNNSAHVSGKKTELTSIYKIPAGNPLKKYYNIQLAYQNKQHTEDTNSQLIAAAIHYSQKSPINKKNDWNKDSFFRIEIEDYTQGNKQDNIFLLIPGLYLSRRRIHFNNHAYWGDKQSIKMELSRREWGSSANFIKLWGRSKWLRTYFDNHSIITRLEQGAIWLIKEISDLPPSLRFFTGGDQTVRGFSYESISPRDSSDKLTGARYASIASIEYCYSLNKKWRLATFIDKGTATNDYKDKWRTGTGFGFRWESILGQIKVDIACAISEEDKPWRIHFSIGPEL